MLGIGSDKWGSQRMMNRILTEAWINQRASPNVNHGMQPNLMRI